MGKGDKKTKKGKIFQGSFGKSRPAKSVATNKPIVSLEKAAATGILNKPSKAKRPAKP